MNKTTSPLGSKLKNLNMDDYIFKQQVSRAKIPLRLRKKYIIFNLGKIEKITKYLMMSMN